MKQSQDKNSQASGTLYIVATPIGNLSDITERAVRTLREVDFIAAEDTRVTRKLLSALSIKKPLISCREHNQTQAGKEILSRVISGESCALVTDAGTPGISDPGEVLVHLFAENNMPITVIPGACAAITGLVLSGLPANRFVFEGFLSTSKRKRKDALRQMKNEKRTMVFFEAPHKLLRTLNDMLQELGDRRISISREMTKMFEETLRLTLSEAITHFSEAPPRGEFVIVVEGAATSPAALRVSVKSIATAKTTATSDPNALGEANTTAEPTALDEAFTEAIKLIKNGFSTKDAVKEAASLKGCSKNELYYRVVEAQKK